MTRQSCAHRNMADVRVSGELVDIGWRVKIVVVHNSPRVTSCTSANIQKNNIERCYCSVRLPLTSSEASIQHSD